MTTNICRFLKFHILSKQLSAAFNVSEAANEKKMVLKMESVSNQPISAKTKYPKSNNRNCTNKIRIATTISMAISPPGMQRMYARW